MYKKLNLGVVGCGVIGESLACLFEDLDHTVKRYDPAKNLTENMSKCEVVFICVPTKADLQFEDIKTAVSYVNLKNKKGIIAIRSTLMPGMVAEFAKEYNREFVYLPEFLRERSALEDEIKPDKVVVGTEKMETFRLFEKLFEPIITNDKIIMMKPVEAELVKVALNSLYTVKVVFGNELYDICQKYGADYYRLFEAFKLDKWINPMHLDPLFDGYRGAGGKCLPKDIKFLIRAGVIKGFLPEMMELVNEENEGLLKGGENNMKIDTPNKAFLKTRKAREVGTKREEYNFNLRLTKRELFFLSGLVKEQYKHHLRTSDICDGDDMDKKSRLLIGLQIKLRNKYLELG